MSASDALADAVTGLINVDNVSQIVDMQESMLHRFEKANETLRTVSELSTQRFKILSGELSGHTARIHRLKKELDGIFKRIRSLKTHFNAKYPEEMLQLDEQMATIPTEAIACDSIDTVRHGEVGTVKKMETLCEEASLD